MNDNLDWALAEGLARQRADQLVAGLQGRLGLDEDHIVQQMLASPALQLARIIRAAEDGQEEARSVAVVNAALRRAGLRYRLRLEVNRAA